jgi:hypothetical protein
MSPRIRTEPLMSAPILDVWSHDTPCSHGLDRPLSGGSADSLIKDNFTLRLYTRVARRCATELLGACCSTPLPGAEWPVD